jgi:hypothetical protein
MDNEQLNLQEEINKELQHYGFTEEDLTPDEMAQLKEEIKIRLQGGFVLDGVLFYKNRYTPQRIKCIYKEI